MQTALLMLATLIPGSGPFWQSPDVGGYPAFSPCCRPPQYHANYYPAKEWYGPCDSCRVICTDGYERYEPCVPCRERTIYTEANDQYEPSDYYRVIYPFDNDRRCEPFETDECQPCQTVISGELTPIPEAVCRDVPETSTTQAAGPGIEPLRIPAAKIKGIKGINAVRLSEKIEAALFDLSLPSKKTVVLNNVIQVDTQAGRWSGVNYIHRVYARLSTDNKEVAINVRSWRAEGEEDAPDSVQKEILAALEKSLTKE
jgi:hypothetical protein